MTDALDSLGPPTDVSESRDAVARRLLEGVSTHAIFMLDGDGKVAAWPAPATTLYGYEEAAVLDRHVRTLFADDEGEGDADSLPEDFFAEPSEESVEFECWHRRADGSVFWATLTLSPLWNDEFHGYAAVSRDTTATKEYERMLERQNDRLKEFTDILAHDLRNPLNVIQGSLTLYEETGDDEHLETIGETTDRMARLVDDLLRVARQGNVVSDPEPTDIGEVVESAWRSLGGDAGATLTYEPVPSVSSDPDRLRELFENLFRNSVEHGSTSSRAEPDDSVEHGSTSSRAEPGDSVEHGSTSSRAEPDDSVEHGSTSSRAEPGDSVEHGGNVTVEVGPLDTGFYVEDDGPGIPDEITDDVFDHGFTTRDDGHGYGLSVVRTIVNAHGWDIVATEAEGGGARFEITGIEFLG
ncbi:PAS domain S-box-containing protein [Halorubrum xinjiangense]|uniref:histidine kinase n=1 Tax=Halorubrum xinjiangense TaxID=261291 RepID=A0A1G7J363_9EURY|nr:PAS domain-containing sensor histidine kinase [Halorubrum xinjiangense]SDF19308.1 PAS domain S-box-containing protein [Halorubrum xinjiangense]